MKRVWKSLSITILAAMIVMSFFGCGNNESYKKAKKKDDAPTESKNEEALERSDYKGDPVGGTVAEQVAVEEKNENDDNPEANDEGEDGSKADVEEKEFDDTSDVNEGDSGADVNSVATFAESLNEDLENDSASSGEQDIDVRFYNEGRILVMAMTWSTLDSDVLSLKGDEEYEDILDTELEVNKWFATCKEAEPDIESFRAEFYGNDNKLVYSKGYTGVE